MARASAYVLIVSRERRNVLLRAERSWGSGPQASEPVPKFGHSRRSPLLVLASFEDGHLTHIAEARKGASAGTDLVRLNLMTLEELDHPINFEDVLNKLPANLRPHFSRVVAEGGLLPPKTQTKVVEVLSQLDETLAARLERLSQDRKELIASLSQDAKQSLSYQKENLTTALEIAGVSTHQIHDWDPRFGNKNSFLDGLPGAYAREDAMIAADLANLPGFRAVTEAPFISAKTFESDSDSSVRVTVVMANRLPLEEQTGADLIYFNELYRAFVMVQYKALEKRGESSEFRWVDGDQFGKEIARMDQLLIELSKVSSSSDPDGFRFSDNPFFMKFCSRVDFNPDDRGSFPGFYLAHGHWKTLVSGDKLKGPQGGRVLNYNNVGRHLTGSEFRALVSGAWVGTTIEQSELLEALIRDVISSGRTVTFAVKRKPPPDPEEVTKVVPSIDGGTKSSDEKQTVSLFR